METALRFSTTVLPGHRIEVLAPELPEGASVALLVYRLPKMTVVHLSFTLHETE